MAKYEQWLTEDNLILLKAWVRDGMSFVDIAKKIGIATSTFFAWRSKYEAIQKAVEHGREVTDVSVENAFYNRCIGYTIKVRKGHKSRRVEYDPETGKKVAEYDEIIYSDDDLHVPADVKAQEFWLFNRKKGVWSAREDTSPQETDSGNTGVIVLAAREGEENAETAET